MTFYTQVQKLKYLSQCQVILLQFEVYKENTLLYFFKSEHNSFIFPEFTLLVPVKQECNKWQLPQLHCHPENDYCKGSIVNDGKQITFVAKIQGSSGLFNLSKV